MSKKVLGTVIGLVLITGCAAMLPSPPDGKPIVTKEMQCGVIMSGYDQDGDPANGPEMVYLSYQGKAFAVAEFEPGQGGQMKGLTIEVASGDTQTLTLAEVKALDLDPCTALFYSLQH